MAPWVWVWVPRVGVGGVKVGYLGEVGVLVRRCLDNISKGEVGPKCVTSLRV